MISKTNINILLACEESQRVCLEFRKAGFNAFSNDLLECSGGHPEWHLKMDFKKALEFKKWRLLIAFPPCTYLTVTGNKWFYHPEDSHLPVEFRRPHPRFPDRKKDREHAITFFMALANADVPKIAIENPVGVISGRWRKPDQIIKPYWFGDPYSKKTCLWLKNLPKLKPTNIVDAGEYIVHKSGKRTSKWYYDAAKLPREERSKIRSKTFKGIAEAMCSQWGQVVEDAKL